MRLAEKNKQYVNFYPISEVSEDTPIEFSVTGSSREYISLRDTLLYIKAKIVKGDGSPQTSENNVGFINMPLHSLWSQVDVTFNQKLVSSSSNNYPYRPIYTNSLELWERSKRYPATRRIIFQR